MTEKTDEFLEYLKQLLKKYNACISWDCNDSSDMHGIRGACMNVQLEGEKERKVSDGYTIFHYEL